MQIAPTPSDEKSPVKPRTALQREASRRNGSRGRGPKTPEGKARSSRNACRHGLTVLAISDPQFEQHIMEFAREIAGPKADLAELAIAARVAAAQIDLKRARFAALALLSASGVPDLLGIEVAALNRLAAIKKYEGRFFARRTKAIRELDAWRLGNTRQRVQNDKTNLTRAGQLALALATDDSGLSGRLRTEQRMDPASGRTRPPGPAATQPAPQTDKTNLRPSEPTCETDGNGERCSARTGNVTKRAR